VPCEKRCLSPLRDFPDKKISDRTVPAAHTAESASDNLPNIDPRSTNCYQRYRQAESARMASLNVRNLSEATHKALRIRAAQHGRSMEAEIRAILDDAVNPRRKIGLGSMLAAIGEDFGGIELDITRDKTPADPADFE
jgi:antitoxin FitA